MHIAVVTRTFLPTVGGAEVGIHEIYRRIGEHHNVTVVSPMPRTGPMNGREVLPYTVRYTRPRRPRLRNNAIGGALTHTSVPYLAELALLARRRRIDVVNFHFLHPAAVAGTWLVRRLGARVLISLVGRSDVLPAMNPLRRGFTLAATRSADAYLPNSSYYLGGARVDVPVLEVPYGVDTEAFSPLQRSSELRRRLGCGAKTLLMLCVQRLDVVKRVDRLIEVLARLRNRGEDVQLCVVGTGGEEASLRRQAERLEVGDSVTFAGFVSEEELPAYYASAEVFLSHSESETFGVTFVEAMSCALPIVAADTSCVRDTVRPEVGMVVRPGDVEAFSDAVLAVAGDSGMRQRLGSAGRLRAQRDYDWEVIACRYEELLAGYASRARCD